MPRAVIVKELLRSIVSRPTVSRNSQGQWVYRGFEGYGLWLQNNFRDIVSERLSR